MDLASSLYLFAFSRHLFFLQMFSTELAFHLSRYGLVHRRCESVAKGVRFEPKTISLRIIRL